MAAFLAAVVVHAIVGCLVDDGSHTRLGCMGRKVTAMTRGRAARRAIAAEVEALERRALLSLDMGPIVWPSGPAGVPGDGTLDITFLSGDYGDSAEYHATASVVESKILSLEPFRSRADQIRFHVVDNAKLLPNGLDASGVTAAVTASGQTTDVALVLEKGRYYESYWYGQGNLIEFGVWPSGVRRIDVAKQMFYVFGGLKADGSGLRDGRDWTGLVAPDECLAQGTETGEWADAHTVTSLHNSLCYGLPNWLENEAYQPDAVIQTFARQSIDYWAGPSTDKEAPLVSIAGLTDGAAVSGCVPVAINASDDRGVCVAQLFVDGRLARTSTDSPFTLYWKTGSESLGSHTLVVKATDGAGNVGVSAPVQVNLTWGADASLAGISSGYTYATPNELPRTMTANVWPGEVDTIVVTMDDSGPIRIDLDGSMNTLEWSANCSPPNMKGPHVLSLVCNAIRTVHSSGQDYLVRRVDIPVIQTQGNEMYFKAPGEGSRLSGVTKLSVYLSGRSEAVTYKVDGVVIGKSSRTPYTVSWDTRKVGNGAHTLTAETSRGKVSRAVTVANGLDVTAPKVTLSAPRNNVKLKTGTFKIAGKATDNKGVAEVDLYIDGALITSTAAASFSWKRAVALLSSGKHQIRVAAMDRTGNVGWSSIVTVVRA